MVRRRCLPAGWSTWHSRGGDHRSSRGLAAEHVYHRHDAAQQQLRLRLLTYEPSSRRISNTRDDERLDRLAHQVARHLIFRDKEGIVVTSHLRMPVTSRLFSGIWSP
jgi:hypothetical protein